MNCDGVRYEYPDVWFSRHSPHHRRHHRHCRRHEVVHTPLDRSSRPCRRAVRQGSEHSRWALVRLRYRSAEWADPGRAGHFRTESVFSVQGGYTEPPFIRAYTHLPFESRDHFDLNDAAGKSEFTHADSSPRGIRSLHVAILHFHEGREMGSQSDMKCGHLHHVTK
jgi:hypothetical protein